jgi:hypothetical protein
MPIKPPARCYHSKQPADRARQLHTHTPQTATSQTPPGRDRPRLMSPTSAVVSITAPVPAVLLRSVFRSLDAPQRVNRTGGLADNPNHAP